MKKTNLILCALALVALVAGPAMAKPGEAYSYSVNQNYDLVYDIYSPCYPDDLIHLEGQEHLVVDVDVDAEGNIQAKIRSNHHNVKGTSAAGIPYVAPGNYHLSLKQQKWNNPEEENGRQWFSTKLFVRCPLISQGAHTQNFHLNIWRFVKFYKNDDGSIEMVVQKDMVKTWCQQDQSGKAPKIKVRGCEVGVDDGEGTCPDEGEDESSPAE